MGDDCIDVDDDLGMAVSIWEMTASIWSSWISIWDILSLWSHLACVCPPLWVPGTHHGIRGRQARLRRTRLPGSDHNAFPPQPPFIASTTGARAKAWCLSVHAKASLSHISSTTQVRPKVFQVKLPRRPTSVRPGRRTRRVCRGILVHHDQTVRAGAGVTGTP